MQQHNKNQSKKYQSISVCRIRRSGDTEGDYSDALGNKNKVGKNGSGEEEEDEWVGIQQLSSKGVETKPSFVNHCYSARLSHECSPSLHVHTHSLVDFDMCFG